VVEKWSQDFRARKGSNVRWGVLIYKVKEVGEGDLIKNSDKRGDGLGQREERLWNKSNGIGGKVKKWENQFILRLRREVCVVGVEKSASKERRGKKKTAGGKGLSSGP